MKGNFQRAYGCITLVLIYLFWSTRSAAGCWRRPAWRTRSRDLSPAPTAAWTPSFTSWLGRKPAASSSKRRQSRLHRSRRGWPNAWPRNSEPIPNVFYINAELYYYWSLVVDTDAYRFFSIHVLYCCVWTAIMYRNDSVLHTCGFSQGLYGQHFTWYLCRNKCASISLALNSVCVLLCAIKYEGTKKRRIIWHVYNFSHALYCISLFAGCRVSRWSSWREKVFFLI